jgi:DNA-damage-inducible protein J
MANALASLNTKLESEDKRLFVATAKTLGLSPSNVVRVFVRAFNEWGGFPFEVRRSFPMSMDERLSIQLLEDEIEAGTVRRYSSFDEVLAEVDSELADDDA